MSRKPSLPSYCLHKPSGRAYCRLAGKVVYLGRYDSPESKERYRQILAEYPTPESRKNFIPKSGSAPTVADVVAAYWQHAKGYYGKDSERLNIIRSSVRPLLRLYSTLPAAEFTPKKLKTVRKRIIRKGNRNRQKQKAADGTAAKRQWKPLTRSYVNMLIETIRRVFRWAVEDEMVPVGVYQALMTLRGLAKGRERKVKEPKKVLPVSQEHVDAAVLHLSPEVGAMVRVQLLLCCRPDELTIMRPCDLDMSKPIWRYTISQHKTAYQEGEGDKIILIGPKAQAILKPYIARCLTSTDYVFSPQRALRAFNERRRDSGRYVKRGYIRKANPIGRATERYDDASYRHAVARACDRANIPRWTPNQLRHSGATIADHRFDRQTASLMLRHKRLDTTAIYAEENEAKYREAVAKIG
jgi:integrase